MPQTDSLKGAALASVSVGVPAIALSMPSTLGNPATEPQTWRYIDVLGIHNFFDHTGNCLNGYVSAAGITAVYLATERFIPEDKRKVAVVGAAAVAGSVTTGVNFLYEGGVHVPPYEPKPAEAPLDVADATYGSLTGILFAIVFCVSALRGRR